MGDLIQKIIDFFMGLFGMKKDEALPASTTSHEASYGGHAPSASSFASSSDDDDDDSSSSDYKVIVQRHGAALIEDPDDGERIWRNDHNLEVPREQWVDEWGPAGRGPDDETLANFLMHKQVFEMACQGDPLEAEQKLTGFGYRDAGHYYQVYGTVMKHFADPHGPNVDDGTFQSQRFMSASMKASQMAHRANMQQTTQADPALIAPVEGVTMETYAQIQAQATSASPDQFAALLAQHGMDQAKWQRVSNEWNDRMSKDTTHTLVTIYGQAFQSAGTGQFGAAAQAHAATGYDGSAAGGAEPMPFERCCEIQGAIQAWSNTGQDVNAMLAQTFKMNAAEFAGVHSWWLSQLTADMTRFAEYDRLVNHYQAQYSAGAPAAPDADLSF